MKNEGHRLTLLYLIGAIRHGYWHVSYIKSTRMSHRTLHHNKTVVLYVYMMTIYTSARAAIERMKKKPQESALPPPSLTRSTASPSWILTSPQTKMPRLPYCRDVTFRFGAIITRHSRMLARDASFVSVISTASLWDWCLWRRWGEGKWICVRFEPASYNFFSPGTYYNALFICVVFSGVFVRWKYRDAWSIAGDFWQHYRPTGRDDVKTGDAGQSFDSEWNLVFIEYSHFVQVQYNVLM